MSELNPNWLIAPILIPALSAALGLSFLRWGFARATTLQRGLAIVGAIANLFTAITILAATLNSGRVVLQVGQWPAPFGITVFADGLTATMLVLSAILTFCTIIFAAATLDQRERMNFYPLVLLLLMGVNGAFLAGDIFNLYVFFEVLLMASFALLTLGGQIAQINGGIRYVLLNLLVSTIFLATAGVIYGTMGTLNMAHIAQRIEQTPPATQILVAGLLLVAFGSKAGLFPLFFWLPSSYHTTHPAITALFGGLLTKVGVYTLYRLFPLMFPDYLLEWQTLILAIAGSTMLVGVMGAMAVNTIRRVLSFHIISQVGYMIMGLGLAGSRDPSAAIFGMTAGILYLVHHMIVKTALLMAGGTAEIAVGTGSLLRGRMSGLATRTPMLAFAFFLAAMALTGIPPFSGFVSKLSLLQGAIANERWVIAAVSIIVSLFTLMSMIRLWQTAFWGELGALPFGPWRDLTPRKLAVSVIVIAVLIALSLGIGLFTDTLWGWSEIAAQQVMDREGYIRAVGPIDEIQYMGASDGH
jgi:multicomponent Na+:H+ antiporter subunit D